MKPKQIKVNDKKELAITWQDGVKDVISLKYLRDECPCANCKGETILFKTIRPGLKDMNAPGRYDIVKINVVGGYAIQITWKDRHDTGIYSWEYLKMLANDEGEGKSQNYEPLI